MPGLVGNSRRHVLSCHGTSVFQHLDMGMAYKMCNCTVKVGFFDFLTVHSLLGS